MSRQQHRKLSCRPKGDPSLKVHACRAGILYCWIKACEPPPPLAELLSQKAYTYSQAHAHSPQKSHKCIQARTSEAQCVLIFNLHATWDVLERISSI